MGISKERCAGLPGIYVMSSVDIVSNGRQGGWFTQLDIGEHECFFVFVVVDDDEN